MPFVYNICMSELLKCMCVLSGRPIYYLVSKLLSIDTNRKMTYNKHR